jgi:hypothetical protein
VTIDHEQDKEDRMSQIGYEQLECHIRGIAPLLLHNGQLGDDMCQLTQALGRAVKIYKKQKTLANALETGPAGATVSVGSRGATGPWA